MENYQISINLLCLAEDERKQLMGLIEKANKGVPIYGDWEGKKVWYWDACTDSAEGTQWTGNSWQKNYDSRGMIYATKEEAEEALQRVRCQTMWRRLAEASGEKNNLWNEEFQHFYAYYTSDGEIRAGYHKYSRTELTYFATSESLMKAIEIVGEDNVRKYILGIED